MTSLTVTVGLDIAQQTLNALASNIGNVSTPGYKSSAYSFDATLAASTNSVLSDPSAGNVQQFTQGSITSTGNPLDAAINGQGFFVMGNGGGQVGYSRDGQFAIGSSGTLQGINGENVMGYSSDGKGNIIPNLSKISLSKTPLPPSASSTVSMALNLAGSQSAPTTTLFNATDPTSYNNSQTVTVFDKSGVSHSLQTYFVSSGANLSGPNTYNLHFTLDGKDVTPTTPPSLQFSADGTQVTTGANANPSAIALTLPASGGTSFPVNVDISQVTQFGGTYQAVSVTANGYGVGNFSNFSIGQDGKITASYGNGQSLVVGQVALANFVNPQGLAQTNDGLFLESSASGQPTVGAPGTGALGVLQSSSLESSNVDIASSMVEMITAQRNYQANAEAVKVNDQIMQDLVTLR